MIGPVVTVFNNNAYLELARQRVTNRHELPPKKHTAVTLEVPKLNPFPVNTAQSAVISYYRFVNDQLLKRWHGQ